MINHIAHRILIAAACLGTTTANAETSIYFGRWSISEANPVLSSKGKLYKTVDIAPCGKDFCGVSVADDGSCGPTLFRFLMIHANTDYLVGHGRWGNEKLKLILTPTTSDAGQHGVLLGLGDKTFDFEGREGTMPRFKSEYKNEGSATCSVDATS